MPKVSVGMGGVWLLVVLGSCSLVSGQPVVPSGVIEESSRLGPDLFLTVGFDVWPNQWQTGSSAFGGVTTHAVSTVSVGFIPHITLTYKSFFLSASYMRSLDYNFGKTSGTPFSMGQPTATEADETAKRQETDVTVGYFPLNWLGVSIGYKGIFRDYKFNHIHIFSSSSPPAGTFESDTSYNGPIFGVLGNVRIDDRFSLLGNAFGGYMFTHCRNCGIPAGRTPIGDGTYASSKLTLRYVPKTLPQLSLTLGYRIQIINTEIKPTEISGPLITSGGVDVTHGPVFGLSYRFRN